MQTLADETADQLVELELAANNFVYELFECAAYFAISAEGSTRNNELQTAASYWQAANRALANADSLGKEIGISEKALLARVQLVMRSHLSVTDGDFKNFSILILKYGELCKTAVEDPEARLNHWIIRGRSSQGQ